MLFLWMLISWLIPNPGFDLNDLYVLDASNGQTLSWTDLSNRTLGQAPSSRAYHGFVSDGGKLYVFAGVKVGTGTNMISS